MIHQTSKAKTNNPFTSLKHRNFRLYWTGMCISLIGTWMQNIAQPWLAYSMTKSAFLLSLIGTLQFMPILLFSLFAGVLIDKFPKRSILILTQSASFLITITLAVLVLSDNIAYWHILVMATLLGLVNTIDMPTRQSFAIELVGKDDLMNAIALNSMAFNGARIIGPAIAGLIMGYLGIGFCFLINAFSYLAVVISLLRLSPIPSQKKETPKGKIFEEIRDGLHYIRKSPILSRTLILVAIIGIFVPNFSVLVPVFASEILRIDEKVFGLLMSSMGIGSLLGALFIATYSKNGPQKRVLEGFPWAVGILMILCGLTNHFFSTALLLAVTGFCFVSFSSSANSQMQLNAASPFRGRVISVYTLVFAGSTPLGNLFAGLTSEYFTARGGFIACGLSVILLMALTLKKGEISDSI